MSNTWHQQPTTREPGEQNGTPRARVGSMLRDYREQQQHSHQYSSASTTPFQGPDYNPYSPIPPSEIPQQPSVWPTAQNWPSQRTQGWVEHAMQTVRSWSGKVAAVQGRLFPHPPTVPPSMVLYRPGAEETRLAPKSKPWKRSHALRVSRLMRERRLRWKKKQPHVGRRIAISVVFAFLLLLVVAASSTGAYAYAFYQSQLPQLKNLANLHISQTTHIYDRNGVLLYDAYDNSGRRTPITYDDVPKVMQDAMIAAEDHTFWTNSGIDPQGILRAATQYAQTHSVQSGGSTITQQVIKNLTGNDQVTLDRKLNEAALAIGLTQQYSKAKILEMYFNISAFGTQDEGVEAAVEEYFGLPRTCDSNFKCTPAIVHLNDNYNPTTKTYTPDPLLGLARASLLAGMPQDPVHYDPTLPQNRQGALERQREVLGEMVGLQLSEPGLGLITDTTAQQAEALTAKFITKITRYNDNIRCPHFVYWVIQQAEDALGGGPEGVNAFLTGGFNIRTTIDANLEAYVEGAVTRHLTQPEYQMFLGDYGPLNQVHNVNDSAVVVMNAKTAEVLAMDGSADWTSIDPRVNGQFNVALAPRQPGSSFKPIVYATAFEMGWYPGIVLPDIKTYFPNGGSQTNPEKNAYHPTDYGNLYHGWRYPIRLDLANSVNVPAVKAFEFAGIDNVVNTARRFGITAIDQAAADYNKAHNANETYAQLFGPSLALGTAGIPLIQMVGAYQVFANQGVRIPPQGILDIWDNYGHHIYHYVPHGIPVLSPQIAYMMTSMLSDERARTLEFGNDHVLSFYDWDPTFQVHQVATKTGTTDNFKDNLTIGYTPDVVVGIWSGNADNSDMHNTIGLTGAAPIWHSVIERVSGAPCNTDGTDVPCGNFNPAYLHFTQGTFVVPPGIHQGTMSSIDGLKGSGVTDWLLDGEDPQQSGAGGSTTGNPTGNVGGTNAGNTGGTNGNNGQPKP